MMQVPNHAQYKRVVINSFSTDIVKGRISLWNEFLENECERATAPLLLADHAESARSSSTTPSARRGGEGEGRSSTKRELASDCVLSYSSLHLGPMSVTLQLDHKNLPSFCKSNNKLPSSSSASPAIVSLTSKMLEFSEYERERRRIGTGPDPERTGDASLLLARNITKDSNNLSMFDVPQVLLRAIKCVQYAHLGGLVHGRLSLDSFFVSSVIAPWEPTLCLGELALVPQFFANMGQALAHQTKNSASNNKQVLTSAASTNNYDQQQQQQRRQEEVLLSAPQHLQAGCWWRLLAPEILRKDPYDGAADVWGLGVLAVQLCLVAGAYDSSLWLNNLSTKDLQDANLLSPTLSKLPPAAVSFATMCLKGNPSERPTVTQLLNHPWLKQSSMNKDKQEGGYSCSSSSSSGTAADVYGLSSSSSQQQEKQQQSTNNNDEMLRDPNKVKELIEMLKKRNEEFRASTCSSCPCASCSDPTTTVSASIAAQLVSTSSSSSKTRKKKSAKAGEAEVEGTKTKTTKKKKMTTRAQTAETPCTTNHNTSTIIKKPTATTKPSTSKQTSTSKKPGGRIATASSSSSNIAPGRKLTPQALKLLAKFSGQEEEEEEESGDDTTDSSDCDYEEEEEEYEEEAEENETEEEEEKEDTDSDSEGDK